MSCVSFELLSLLKYPVGFTWTKQRLCLFAETLLALDGVCSVANTVCDTGLTCEANGATSTCSKSAFLFTVL